MASVNKWIGIGYLGNDPEMRHLPNGDAATNIQIACTEKWKSKNGEKKEHTEWVRIVFFGKLAEIADEYLKKGSQVYIEGQIRTKQWEDKEGNKREQTQIVAQQMKMLDKPQTEEKPKTATKPGGSGGIEDMKDDIPW